MINPRFSSPIKSSSKPSNFCPGCGHSIILKNLGKVIEKKKISQKTVFSIDIGCSLLAWDYFDVDTLQTHHGRTTAASVGIKRGKPESIVITYMGDGGGYAIGLQSLIHAAYRDENISVILVNNTNYAMTGGQMAPTTLPDEITNSSPDGYFTQDKPFMGPELLSGITSDSAYIARGDVSNPVKVKDYIEKAITHQMEGKGFSFVEILSYCPINWKTDAKGSVEFLEKMKKSFSLGEIKSGVKK